MTKNRKGDRCIYCLTELKEKADICKVCGSLLKNRTSKPADESVVLLGVLFILAGIVSFGKMTGASIILFLAGYWLITRA